ncbi:hypothetical protein REPUB_Repub05bG0056200 [Reevesia pubescens]
MNPYYLPEELLLQILYKLPIKSLGKCMCVSKAWNFLIKNPSFIYTHLNNQSKNCCRNNSNNLFLVTSKDIQDEYSLHFDDQKFSKYTQLQYIPFGTQYSIVGSCNGLLCFADFQCYFDIKFSLCNPVIRRFTRLPKPYFCGLPYKISVGFGFDSKRNDYKILKIMKKDVLDECNEIELYSLERNCWEILAPLRYNLHYDDFVVFVNGVVHWIAFERVNDGGRSRCRFLLLGFDMSNDVFKEIMLPESLSNLRERSHMYVRPYGELSSITVIEWACLYEESNIWVMKKYGVVETWSKMYSFGIIGPGLMPMVLGFKKNGGLILRIYGNNQVVSHDPESSEINYFGIPKFCGNVISYMESLVLLDQVIDARGENSAKYESYASNSIEGAADGFIELAAADE